MTRRRLLAFFCVVVACCSAEAGDEPRDDPPAAQAVAIRLSTSGDRVEVTGASEEVLDALRRGALDAEEWQEVLSVFVEKNGAAASTPMIGEYGVEGGVVAFTPRFPLRRGLPYRVAFNPGAIGNRAVTPNAVIVAKLELPTEPVSQRTRVEAVYPSSDRLPANLLKFYIHFSAPMRRGDAYRYVHVMDANGQETPDAFLEIGEELWDADARRLTLLFDPGRIKRGLKPNEDVGAPLLEGREYSLIVDASWRDAQGAPLHGDYRKRFSVVAPDGRRPEPVRWTMHAPGVGTHEPLVMEFDEPLDHALLQRMLAVRDAAGKDIGGAAEIGDEERRWSFKPSAPWPSGRFELVVAAELEDLAGNSVGRAFEVLDSTPEVDAASHRHVTLPFDVESR